MNLPYSQMYVYFYSIQLTLKGTGIFLIAYIMRHFISTPHGIVNHMSNKMNINA